MIICSYLFAKEVWLPEISGFSQKSEMNMKTVFWIGLIFITVFVSSLGVALWLRINHDATFWQLLLAAYVTQLAINIADLVIFDIAIYKWWYPSWVQFEGISPIHDNMYHVKAGIRGITTIGIPMSLLAALVALLF